MPTDSFEREPDSRSDRPRSRSSVSTHSTRSPTSVACPSRGDPPRKPPPPRGRSTVPRRRRGPRPLGTDSAGTREIAFAPARAHAGLTGVPAIVDLAAMRDALEAFGADPANDRPRVRRRADRRPLRDRRRVRSPDAFRRKRRMEFTRNRERYELAALGAGRVRQRPGHCPRLRDLHQVNLEYLAGWWFVDDDGCAYPDTLVGTDSHTPMVNGLGVLGGGWAGSKPRQPCSASRSRCCCQRSSASASMAAAGRVDGHRPRAHHRRAPASSRCGRQVRRVLRAGVAAVPLETGPPSATCPPSTAHVRHVPDRPETLRYLPLHRPPTRADRAGRGLREGARALPRTGSARPPNSPNASRSTSRRWCPASPGRPARTTACPSPRHDDRFEWHWPRPRRRRT